MPRTNFAKSLLKKEPEPVEIDYIGVLLTSAMRQRGMTYQTFAPMVGMTVSGAAEKKHRGAGRFKVDELFRWCRVLGISESELARAVTLAYRNAK